MAETAIAAVLSKFGQLAASEAKVLLEVGDNMMRLRDRLEWLQAFIRDADRKRRAGTDGFTHVWVRQTRDVAFEAEDLLDEFFYKVDLKSQGYRGWKMWRKYLSGFCTQMVIRHGLSARIKSINSRLKSISENQKEYKIEHIPLATLTSSTTATSAWRDGYENAVGLDDDVKILENMMLHKDYLELIFISILGESGVGKRTLVQIICANIGVMDHFEVVVWHRMPPHAPTEDLLQVIYKTAYLQTSQHQPADRGTDTADKIQRLLAKKRYLVIIQGMSSKAMLNCVRASLPDDNNGSRMVLILDTENEVLAWHANSMNKEGINGIHLLNRLDEKRSGQLFCSKAFRKELYDERENMSQYDKIVYDITGGYPLAIVVLAGLLRFKEKPGQWEAVLQQLMSGSVLEEGQDGEGNQITRAGLYKEKCIKTQMSTSRQASLSTRTTIERVFWASFEDLPNDLKSCFLYFAFCSKNFLQPADVLVRRWVAEGFIKPQKGKSMEEVGHDYLIELVLRCLVQIINMNVAGGINDIMIHRSLHGFLHSEACEAGFIDIHDMHDVFVRPSVRRLSFVSFEGGYTAFTNKFPKLRTFSCWVRGEEDRSNHGEGINKKRWHDLKFLCRSKFLRVISTVGLKVRELPDKIGDLIHMRYLFVDSKDLNELPSSIKRLLNLETLDIRCTQVKKIDPGFWKNKTLRHVIAEQLTLPASIEEELGELQTLHGVKPAEEGEWDEQNCPLHKMPKLLSLELHSFKDAEHGAGLKAALGKMQLLGHLKLQGDMISSWVFTGRRLQYLQTVELEGMMQWQSDEEFNDLDRVRPNLVRVILTNLDDAPEHIQEKLRNVVFNRSQFSAVDKVSYKLGETVQVKWLHQGEPSSFSRMEQ